MKMDELVTDLSYVALLDKTIDVHEISNALVMAQVKLEKYLANH